MVVVLGSGFSLATTKGDPRAGWSGLIADGLRFGEANGTLTAARRDELLTGLTGPALTSDDLIATAGALQSALETVPGLFGRWLRSSVAELRAADARLLDAVRALGVLMATTNYDLLLSQHDGPPPVPWTDPRRAQEVLRMDRAGVLHLHGVCTVPESVVFGRAGYDAVLRDRFAQFRQQVLSADRTLLFVGCGEGLRDPNVGALLAWTDEAHFAHSHYRILRPSDDPGAPLRSVTDLTAGDSVGAYIEALVDSLGPRVRLLRSTSSLTRSLDWDPGSLRSAPLTHADLNGLRALVGEIHSPRQARVAADEVSRLLAIAQTSDIRDPATARLVAESATRVADRDPAHARLLSQAAGLLAANGDHRAAFTMIERLLSIGHAATGDVLSGAIVLMNLGELEESWRVLRELRAELAANYSSSLQLPLESVRQAQLATVDEYQYLWIKGYAGRNWDAARSALRLLPDARELGPRHEAAVLHRLGRDLVEVGLTSGLREPVAAGLLALEQGEQVAGELGDVFPLVWGYTARQALADNPRRTWQRLLERAPGIGPGMDAHLMVLEAVRRGETQTNLAVALAEESLQIWEQGGYRVGVLRALGQLALVHLRDRGGRARSVRHAGAALELASHVPLRLPGAAAAVIGRHRLDGRRTELNEAGRVYRAERPWLFDRYALSWPAAPTGSPAQPNAT